MNRQFPARCRGGEWLANFTRPTSTCFFRPSYSPPRAKAYKSESFIFSAEKYRFRSGGTYVFVHLVETKQTQVLVTRTTEEDRA
jgi:hypothetical protein